MKTIGFILQSSRDSIRIIHSKQLYAYFIPAALIAVFFYFNLKGGESIVNFLSFAEDWWLIGSLIKGIESTIGFLSFFLFEFALLVLLSPLNSILAEKVQAEVRGENASFSFAIFLSSLGRMMVIFVIAFFAQLGLGIILWLFSFLLGDNFYEIASLLNISFFIGFSFWDFILEIENINSRSSWKFARKNWLACIILGLFFQIGIYFPLKYGFIELYLVSITLIPHLLTILASYLYFRVIQVIQE